jgi:hypothetical protein
MDAEIQKVSLSYEVGNTDPSLDVYKVDASFTTSYINPSFNVSFTVPTFDVAYTAATYDVIYVNLTPTTIEIGIFLLKESLFDFGFIADQHALSVGKSFSDAASFQTTIRYDFGKPLSETAAFSDSPAKNIGSARTDDFYVVDQIDTIGFSKVITDFGNLATEIRFDTTKLLDETSTLSDEQLFSVSKRLNDISVTTDVASFFSGKRLQDAWSATDNNQLTFGKLPNDEAVFTTEAALALTKLLVSNIDVTDDIDGEASIEDDQNKLFFKSCADNGYVSESNVKSFSTGNSDSASVTDSGSLYGQDYVDNPFYFAEDYVGYSTTF